MASNDHDMLGDGDGDASPLGEEDLQSQESEQGATTEPAPNATLARAHAAPGPMPIHNAFTGTGALGLPLEVLESV